MIIDLLRYKNRMNGTLGMLMINNQFSVYSLENGIYQRRIPTGIYQITLRTWGGFHNRYKKRFKSFHKGMLWIRNVTGFKYILIHTGNKTKDTGGCILTGMTSDSNNYCITNGTSTPAYEKFYKTVIQAFDKKELVYINVKNIEKY